MKPNIWYCLCDGLLLLLLPPVLLGLLNKVKAKLQGRQGAPIVQPWFDIIKLMQKEMVISLTTCMIFRFAPCITVIMLLIAGAFLPVGPQGFGGFTGDMILFFYLMSVGRFFTAAAALDTGSAFEGMGASREVTWGCLAELAVFFSLLCLARLSGSLNLTQMLEVSHAAHAASVLLCCVGLFVVCLVECNRVPFDDPTTHLELTMTHEAMVLDHGGPKLAEIQYGCGLKLYLYCLLIARIVLPESHNPWGLRLAAIGLIIVLVMFIGFFESIIARLKLSKIPSVLGGAALMCALGFLLTV